MSFRREISPTRRDLLKSSAALPLAWLLGGRMPAFAGEPLRRIQRSETPLTLETPMSALEQPLTPNELFYVRNHFPAPMLQANTWRLRVEGAVERQLDLTLEDLRRMPSRNVTMTLECAGNSRSMLVPATRGVQWGHGAVSTTEWTGVSLIDVLNRAGLRPSAVDVVLEGADRGEIASEPRTPGVIQFARSIPIAKARQQTVLLAHGMRNADLPANHGFPVRAIVPGWYGVASVKWITKIIVTDRPYNGFFQSLDYSIYERRPGLVTVTPITEIQVKSLIVSPTPTQRIAPNTPVRVHGVAWSGEANVARVEISADNGRTWTAARLLSAEQSNTWRMWEYAWRTPVAAGHVRLMARATDAAGNTQPMQRDTDRRSYLINHVLPVEIDVR